jgi:hypothetical protein
MDIYFKGVEVQIQAFEKFLNLGEIQATHEANKVIQVPKVWQARSQEGELSNNKQGVALKYDKDGRFAKD